MKRLLVIPLIVVLAATSAWLWYSLGQERERSDRLQAEVATLRQSPGRAPDSQLSTAPAPRELRGSAGIEQSGTSRGAAGFIAPRGDPVLLADSDHVAASKEVHEAILAMQYDDLARILDIPQEIVDQLIAIKARALGRQIGGVAPNRADRDAWELQRQQDHLETNTELVALIGEKKLQKFTEYEESLGERQQVKELRLELMDSSEPLASDKAERLIRALAQERRQFYEEMKAMLPQETTNPQSMDHIIVAREYVAERTSEWEGRLLKAAEAELSPAQMKIYREMLEVQSRMQRALGSMRAGSEE